VNHEAILQFLVVLNKELKHHFAKFVSDTAWEVVEQTK
jgi:hypothetical protein